MSELGCACGHTFVDQTDNIFYKAKFLRNQALEKHWEYSDVIASFIEAIQSGQLVTWFKDHFL